MKKFAASIWTRDVQEMPFVYWPTIAVFVFMGFAGLLVCLMVGVMVLGPRNMVLFLLGVLAVTALIYLQAQPRSYGIWTRDIYEMPFVIWPLCIIGVSLLCLMVWMFFLFAGVINGVLYLLAIGIARILISRWMQRRQQPEEWHDPFSPPDDGPGNFPGGSRVPKVPMTPWLSGSEARHFPASYMPYEYSHAFSEIEAEMRRGSNATRHWFHE